MRNNLLLRISALGLLAAAVLAAQDTPLPQSSVRFNFPADAPIAATSWTTGGSFTGARGAALVVDLHMGLTLRNVSQNRIHGVTLRVVTQEVALGGKASVSLPSLNIGPGETFPLRIDQQLIRPTQVGGGPLVEVTLDGVLFQDLSFYGPDRLHSRRIMTAWAMEAQRDREHFKRILAQSGREGLEKAVLESLSRQADRPQLNVRVVKHGPAVTSAATAAPERTERFAFLQFPDSPVQPVGGWAQVSGNQARAPEIEVRNRSDKPVKYVELGWLVRDASGQEYLAASLPAADPELYLPAGKTAKVTQDTQLTFSHAGKPVNVQSMTGFVSEVEFADGKVWVPNRQSLGMDVLPKVLAPSPEEQNLTNLYVHKGMPALIEELKKY
ncbi:MAG TPA: hypothetical protein VN736_17345 [Candidatus Limnocylindrales bacterium]|nr:hypothetical protein [Candidatus Limnocylindrales bacterium]